jgi:hypothetical protein
MRLPGTVQLQGQITEAILFSSFTITPRYRSIVAVQWHRVGMFYRSTHLPSMIRTSRRTYCCVNKATLLMYLEKEIIAMILLDMTIFAFGCLDMNTTIRKKLWDHVHCLDPTAQWPMMSARKALLRSATIVTTGPYDAILDITPLPSLCTLFSTVTQLPIRWTRCQKEVCQFRRKENRI